MTRIYPKLKHNQNNLIQSFIKCKTGVCNMGTYFYTWWSTASNYFNLKQLLLYTGWYIGSNVWEKHRIIIFLPSNNCKHMAYNYILCLNFKQAIITDVLWMLHTGPDYHTDTEFLRSMKNFHYALEISFKILYQGFYPRKIIHSKA